MIPKISFIAIIILFQGLFAQNTKDVFPGADESTPSRSEYFSWINNTNEGATESQTMINLEFFQWMHDEYGMVLDIYAFDAGAIDGKRFYGSVNSDRFRKQFPKGFTPIYQKAKSLGTRLGVWGGPDGFGNTPREEAARTEQMVSLCRDFEFALFKFDAVCGPLRPEKEDAFIHMMTECRKYSPDLILLNHRLGLERAQAFATTFLWGGKETYIDVFSTNTTTAPHHRADAISRGLVPELKRLTEDHGVCLSSSLDYWEDDLILQAFNRCLILSPQLYGSPWFLRDEEFPKLARIFNLHRKYRDILVHGMALPEETFGPSAVSRGNGKTRLITLRNLTWDPVKYRIPLDERIGIQTGGEVHCRQLHPTERILGNLSPEESVEVAVAPFQSCLLLVTTDGCDEPAIQGCDFEVVRNIPDRSVLIRLLGLPGTRSKVRVPNGHSYKSASIDGQAVDKLIAGKTVSLRFPGEKHAESVHRRLAELKPCEMPEDAQALYEATVFAADNNALEVRSLYRSGPTRIPQVKAARDAFFQQAVFVDRGIWDRNLFDSNPSTGFWPSRKYRINQTVKDGCLRLDLGKITDADQIIIRVPNEYALQPLLNGEGNHVEVSNDLRSWEQLTYLAGTEMVIQLPEPARYLRFRSFPDQITEIEGYKDGQALPRDPWRASNLFAHPGRMKPVKAWYAPIKLDAWVKNSTLCIAIEGEHGVEGAYAAMKVDGKLLGCPDRAPSFPSNTWVYVNARGDKNYTYYAPVTEDMIGKPIDVYVLVFDEEKINVTPVVWVTAYPAPNEVKLLELTRND